MDISGSAFAHLKNVNNFIFILIELILFPTKKWIA